MKTAIFCIGKLREAWWSGAAAEYVKRLGRFGGVEVRAFADMPEPKNASPADIDRLVEAECAPLLEAIRPRDHVVALCVEGKQLSSEALARRVEAIELSGAQRLVFVIGGSNGLSEALLRRAADKLSFSQMTFPHQLARVMLLEQLYRARKILAHEPYHK